MWRFKYCHEMQLHCQLVATILSYLMILGVLCQHFQKPQSEKDTVWGVEDMDFHQHQWLVENDVDEVWMMPSWTEHDAVMWLHLLTTAPCEELGSAYQQPDAANWPLAYLKAPPIAARPTKNVTVLLFSLNSDYEKRNQISFGTAQQNCILPCVFLWFLCIRSQWIHVGSKGIKHTIQTFFFGIHISYVVDVHECAHQPPNLESHIVHNDF
jgi:hypothetical protein